jgi:hypothetical protein
MSNDQRGTFGGLWAGSAAAMIGLLTMCSGEAIAQNALGDGKGLQANTREGSGGRNYQRPSLEREVQFRNSIATGNAPGGLSFRGDLGYRAAGEFSADLGSDSLYSFRRDTLYSGLAGMGIRGTDALQYQFSMTTGSRITRNMMGNLAVSRDYGASSADFSGGIGGTDPIAIDPQGRFNESRADVSGSLRSTSTYSATSGLVPELISVYESGIERDRYGVVSTPLMGLVSTPMDTGVRVRRPGEVAAQRVKTSYSELIEDYQLRARELMESEVDPVEDPTETDTTGLVDDATLQAETNEWINNQLGRLQRQLLGIPEPVAPLEQIEAEETETEDPENGVIIRDPMEPRSSEEGAPEISFDRGEGLGGQTTYEIDPKTLELLRKSSDRVTYLVDPKAGSTDVYVVHMRAGERLLKNGRYFDAEERFTNAMAVRQGNVPAQMGRLHAQIGAGVVISASVNLQQLLSEHIEVISVRYSGDLLPSEERVKELILTLRERAGLVDRGPLIPEEPTSVRVACGLLMAYLGFQIGDQQQMEDGFGVIRNIGSASDQRLVLLLDTVWSAALEDAERGTQP